METNTRRHLSTVNYRKQKTQNSVDWFLQQPHPLDVALADQDSGTRWEQLVHQIAAEPFDVEEFRAVLLAKLERLRYQTKLERFRQSVGRGVTGRTFRKVLEDAGVLEVLLAEYTLRELWKSDVLSRISRRSKELSVKKESLQGISIDEHKQRVRAMEKELKQFREIATKNNFEYVEVAPERLLRKIIGERTAILAWQRMGPKERILLGPRRAAGKGRTGGRRMDAHHAVRNEDTPIQANIYRTLKTRLQNDRTRKGISDIFLCQLAELVFGAPDVKYVTNGKTLRRAIKRIIKYLHR
jgi:hypothetical protein